MNDYATHLCEVESLLKAIREKAPAKDKEVMFLCERAISHLWEIRDIADNGYPLPDVVTSGVTTLPRAMFPGQF